MISRIIRIANKIEEVLLAFVILSISLLVVIQVLLRSSVGINFYWLEETGRHALVFITFLGSSVGVRHASHFSMTVLETILTEKSRNILRSLVNLACCLFFVLIVYHGFGHVVHLHKYQVMTSSLQIPLYIPYLSIPVFSIFISLRFFIICVKEVGLFVTGNKELRIRS